MVVVERGLICRWLLWTGINAMHAAAPHMHIYTYIRTHVEMRRAHTFATVFCWCALFCVILCVTQTLYYTTMRREREKYDLWPKAVIVVVVTLLAYKCFNSDFFY